MTKNARNDFTAEYVKPYWLSRRHGSENLPHLVSISQTQTHPNISQPTVKFKMRLFKAACTSSLPYGCEAWVLTQALTAKLDTFARKCYRIMLGISQAEIWITNTDLYHVADEHPISETIRQRQLQFTEHCLHMPKDEPANIYVIYQSKIRRSKCHENPGLTNLDQISKCMSTDKTVRFSAEEIANYAKDKQLWNLSITTHKLPACWWWYNCGGLFFTSPS